VIAADNRRRAAIFIAGGRIGAGFFAVSRSRRSKVLDAARPRKLLQVVSRSVVPSGKSLADVYTDGSPVNPISIREIGREKTIYLNHRAGAL